VGAASAYIIKMDVYSYIIIDDDSLDRLLLGKILMNYPFLKNTATFSSPDDGLQYLSNNKVDILFLDVKMPGMTGFELLEKIKERISCVIMITSYSEYAVQGFEANALDFITKPFSEERIYCCVKRAKEFLEMKHKTEIFDLTFNTNSILVKEGYKQVTIQLYEVIYLEALKDYTKIVSINKSKPVTTVHSNLGLFMESNDYFRNFIRIHRSYAINKLYVKKILTNEIILENDAKLPIGQSFKKNLQHIL